jgi:hypothetical protein
MANNRPASILDMLTDEQMEELQDAVKRESEEPTVSQRLSQMMQKVAASNDNIKQIMEEAKLSAAEKFANMLATPLSELAKSNDFEFDNGQDLG